MKLAVYFKEEDGTQTIHGKFEKDSSEALEYIDTILMLQNKYGESCPYSFKYIDE